MPDYDAIFFDFDGVIVDSEPVHYECWTEILAPFGIVMDWETYARVGIGVSDRLLIERFCGLGPGDVPFDEVWARYPAKRAMFVERMMAAPPVAPGLKSLLPQLAGWRIALVTSSGRPEVEPILEAAGVSHHFETKVFGSDVRNLKPSPEPYLLAATRLGIERALVVEDSDAGVASGRAAGFDVLQVRSAEEMTERVRRHLAIP